MANKKRTDQVGRAGEYFVAAELNRRGLDAVTFTGNMPDKDIVAIDSRQSRTVFIQVKTRVKGNWHTKASEGCVPGRPDFFWVFVHIPETESVHPRFWVVPDKWLRKNIREVHDEYMIGWRDKHGNDKIRVDHHSISEKRLRHWEERWDLLVVPKP